MFIYYYIKVNLSSYKSTGRVCARTMRGPARRGGACAAFLLLRINSARTSERNTYYTRPLKCFFVVHILIMLCYAVYCLEVVLLLAYYFML